MKKTERLLETFLDLERSRQRDADLRLEYESQLRGIRAISEARTRGELFNTLSEALRGLVNCEHIFILESAEDGDLVPTLSTSESVRETSWVPETLFQRVLAGKPAAVFDVALVKEWSKLPKASRKGMVSAIHFKLTLGKRKAILVCTHAERHYFGPAHIHQLRRFVPFVSQAFTTLELKQAVNERDRFFGLSLELMAILDAEGHFKQVNGLWHETLGYSEAQLKSQAFFDFVLADDRQRLISNLSRAMDRHEPLQDEYRFLRKDGGTVWLSCSIAKEETDALYYVSARDITARVEAEQRLLRDATHDPLTGLFNRAVFIDRVVQVLEHDTRSKECNFALFYIDLDRFKVINDSLGHSIGDQLLIEVSGRIKEVLRASDSVARIGGDEFVVLLIDLIDPARAIFLAERLIQRIEAPMYLDRHEIKISASIGITFSQEGYETSEAVLRDADLAMYAAKKSGKVKHMIFDKKMYQQAVAQLQLEMDMRSALENREFTLFFQPIVEMTTSAVVSFESLIRWEHPQKGIISPQDFVPVAEENGFIIELGNWIFETACQNIKILRESDPQYRATSIHINISPRQFWQDGFVEHLLSIVTGLKLPPHAVILEVTESVILKNAAEALEVFEQIQRSGFHLYIDDFGTGYSSLSYLHQFPFEGLKIDRSFVDLIGKDEKCQELIKTIVQLANNFGLEVVAEGVETRAQSEYLIAQGCRYAQGYLYAKPQRKIETRLKN